MATPIINSSPGVNLNSSFRQFGTAREMYEEMLELTKPGGDYTVRNFVGVLTNMSLESCTVVTDLFPIGALGYYARKNLGLGYSESEKVEFHLEMRGGDQGDYAFGAKEKIQNVIKCLTKHPYSKRAVFPIPFSSETSSKVDFEDKGQTKCVRELHFYLEGSVLNCTGFLRMQNANIFPKNIYYISKLMNHISGELSGTTVGSYTHFVTSLCLDRSAKHC